MGSEYVAPDGAETYFGFGFYKYAAPDGAGDGATPKTATGTGALTSNVPAGRPMAVWGGRTGQRVFELFAVTTMFKNRPAWIVEWHCPPHDKRIKDHDLRPYFLPCRWKSERVFDFMKCLYWNSALFSPGTMLRGISKPRHSRYPDPNRGQEICYGAKLSYGIPGDANILIAGYVEDLSITHQHDLFILKWTSPTGCRLDDARDNFVSIGANVEKQWLWRRGCWSCESKNSSNLRAE